MSVMEKISSAIENILHGEAHKKKFTEKDADPKELAMGIKVEMEHTPDRALSKKITLDHLAELARYYTRLKKMEAKGEEDKKRGKKYVDDDKLPSPSSKQAKKILAFLAKTKNIDDDKMHGFFEKIMVNPHKGETVIYRELQKKMGK